MRTIKLTHAMTETDSKNTTGSASHGVAVQRLVRLLDEWMTSANECFEDGNDHEGEEWLKKVKEVGRAVFPCPKCHGDGGDCDAGPDGRTVSWSCQSCGEDGYILPNAPHEQPRREQP